MIPRTSRRSAGDRRPRSVGQLRPLPIHVHYSDRRSAVMVTAIGSGLLVLCRRSYGVTIMMGPRWVNLVLLLMASRGLPCPSPRP